MCDLVLTNRSPSIIVNPLSFAVFPSGKTTRKRGCPSSLVQTTWRIRHVAMGTATTCFDRRSNSRKRFRLGCKGSRQVTKPLRYYNLTQCSVPWVPETFHARFPVWVEDVSACGRHPGKAPRRTREKTSGTQSRCSETKAKFQNILQTTGSVKTHINITAPLIKKFKA